MKKRLLFVAVFGFALMFWILELGTTDQVYGDERPFGIAMHATALAVIVFALSVRRRNCALVLGLFSLLSLWILKLFTTEAIYRFEGEGDGGVIGVIWRATPALSNRTYIFVRKGDLYPDPTYFSFFFQRQCWDYTGEDYYRWLTGYGYAWSTALSVLLFAQWWRSRPRLEPPAPSLKPGKTVYRD